MLEELTVLDRDVEVLTCDACVLSRDRVRTRSFAPADRVDECVVLVLSDEEDLPRLGQRRMDHQQRAGRSEREGERMFECPSELAALRQSAERLVEVLVDPEVLHERLDAPSADDCVQLSTAGTQGLELLLRLESFGPETRSRALEHAPELDRVVDIGACELAHDEAAARERLEEPFVLERHERDPQWRTGDAELLDQTKLGDALTRFEGSVQQELAEPEGRLRRLRVGVVTARHRN